MCRKPQKTHFGDLSCGCKSDCEALMTKQNRDLFCSFFFPQTSFLNFSSLESECIKNNYILKNEATCLH